MKTRRRYTIVYDFDGTLLPLEPWDSEQELLLARLEAAQPLRRLYGRLLVEADRRGLLLKSFKRRYLRLLRGAPAGLLDRVAARLAGRIGAREREALLALKDRGHRLLVASCGTADLSERILARCGVLPCFEALLANRFLLRDGRIAGLHLEVPTGRAKLEAVESLGVEAGGAVAVGDGATDLPLWRWCAVPVAVGARAPASLPACRVVASSAGVLDIVKGLGG